MAPDRPSPRHVSAPTCDQVLDKCMETVQKQKDAMDAKDDVIEKQDELIVTQVEQIENKQRETTIWKIISVILATVLAVKLF